MAAEGAMAALGYVGQQQQSLLNFGGNYLLAAQQHKWNREDAEWTNQKNIEFWNIQNEYNTPAAQKQRLLDAGMNPLFYGLDGNVAGDLSAAQPLGYERASMPNFGNPIQSGIDSVLKAAQIENIQADTAVKNEESLNKVKEREKLIAEADNTRQLINESLSRENLNKSQKENLDKLTSWVDEVQSSIVSKNRSSARVDNATANRINTLLEGEKLIQSATLQDFIKKWEKINAEIKKMSAETGLDLMDLKYYLFNHAKNGFMGTGMSASNVMLFVDRLMTENGFDPNTFNSDDSDSTDVLGRSTSFVSGESSGGGSR